MKLNPVLRTGSLLARHSEVVYTRFAPGGAVAPSLWWSGRRKFHRGPPTTTTRSWSRLSAVRSLTTTTITIVTAQRCFRPRSFSTTTLLHQQSSSNHTKPRGRIDLAFRPAPAGMGNGTVATVTIDHPSRLNSLSSPLLASLTSTLASLHPPQQHPELRCVVVTSTPPTRTPAFSSGADVHEMSALASPAEARTFISAVHAACAALRAVPVPTLARVHGLCLGAGLELVAAADFRAASAVSEFGMPEVALGVPSVVEARLLCDIVGWQRAREMVYLARRYGAAQAKEMQLLDWVAADEGELDGVVEGWVAEVCGMAPQAMRSQKRLVRAWEERGLLEGVEAGVDEFARMFEDGGDEVRSYMRAFTERKKGGAGKA